MAQRRQVRNGQNEARRQLRASFVCIRCLPQLAPPDRQRILGEAGFYALLLGVPLRDGPRPYELDPDIRGAYDSAVREAPRLLSETLSLPHGETDAVELSAAMAAFQGHQRLATMLFNIRIYRELYCPGCEEMIDPLAEWGQGL